MDLRPCWSRHIGCMSRARKSNANASHADAADARALTTPVSPAVRCQLPTSIPLLSDEVRMLDQLLGAEIAKLFQEE